MMFFIMYVLIMIFFVIILIFVGVFGNLFILLMIGVEDMVFLILNMFSYWVMWLVFIFMGLSFFMVGYGFVVGWIVYLLFFVMIEVVFGSGDV